MRFTTSIWVSYFVLAILHSGCSQSPEEKLIGTWDGSGRFLPSQALAMKEENPEITPAEAIAISKAIQQTSLELRADKTFTFVSLFGVLSGTWKIDEAEGGAWLTVENNESIAPQGNQAAAGENESPQSLEIKTLFAFHDVSAGRLYISPLTPEALQMVKSVDVNALRNGIPLSKP